jgi:hypothetical protein
MFNANMVEFKTPTEEIGPTLPAMTLEFDDNWDIIAGSSEEQFGGIKISFKWLSATPTFPPDRDAAR